MDYPLHPHYTERHHDNSTGTSNNYRSFQAFNERSDLPTMIFDNNNMEDENARSPNMLLISTRPSHGLNDPWNQSQLHSTYNSNSIQHTQIQSLSQSERGIAGFVSKLYQCLQSAENNRKYARWCQHDGKDMFIIDCIPEFTEFVLPRLFKHCKFPSFVRQLNIYGFQRDTDARKSKDTKDKESCRWYHPCFRPGRRDLFHLIRRKATRYSRKKRAKASIEEDPETILPVNSGDESDLDDDDQNMVLLVNNEEEDNERRLSSASSVTQSMHPIDYTSATSQLQLGFQGAETNPTTNSPSLISHLPLTDNTSPINTNPLQEDFSSDNADNTMAVSTHHHLQEPLMRDQELRSQLCHMEQQYQKMHSHFQKQLGIAQIQINEQKLRIQQLEGALNLTNHSVKQSTIQPPGGYTSTVCTTIPNTLNENYLQLNHQNSSPRLVTNHRSLYEMQQKPPMNSPRPNYNTNNNYYFHHQQQHQDPVHIKQEEDQHNNNTTWYTPQHQHHRNSLSAAIDSTTSMATAVSSTRAENIVKIEKLKTAPSSSPLAIHNNINNSSNNQNNINRHPSVNDTNRNNNLGGHMNFNTYI